MEGLVSSRSVFVGRFVVFVSSLDEMDHNVTLFLNPVRLTLRETTHVTEYGH